MIKLILFLLLSTSLFSVEINKDNILKYVFISSKKLEYKVVVINGAYRLERLPKGDLLMIDKDIDYILAYIKYEGFKISRECGKLDVIKGESK